MLSFPGSLKVFIAVEPCDMRCSFNGLHQAVASRLGEDPKSGSIFAHRGTPRQASHRPAATLPAGTLHRHPRAHRRGG